MTDPAPRRRRILVVDDNHDAADSLALLLQQYDQDTMSAYDGPAAVRVARDFHPDIVFVDLVMQGMDGFEVAQQLRELERMKLTRMLIVAVTGRDEEAFREAVSEAGFDKHLTKPVSQEQLLEILAVA